tara:strand:- start:400 stop:1317 length:918 start_codon:yes stop_codon:yes gene_type:complete
VQIELKEVSKSFERVKALRSIELNVPSGAKVALVGPNGSGKSTLTRVLMGLLRYEGSAKLAGLCPTKDREALAPRMAYVPQIAPRFGVKVSEFVRLVTRVRGLETERVAKLCEELGLDLDAVGERRFRELSGGMRQKLLIALALAPNCELLIMDEPTASLDAQARQRFFELFERESGDATLVLCSHRLTEIRHLVDHVVVLEEGRVTQTQDARSLLSAGASDSTLEALVSESLERERMTALGFRGGKAGWWIRTVSRDDKMEVLRSLEGELGEALLDLQVRDLETLDLAQVLSVAQSESPLGEQS